MKEKHIKKKKKKTKDSSSSSSSSLSLSSSSSLTSEEEEKSSCSSSSDGGQSRRRETKRRKTMMFRQLKSAIEKGNLEKIKTLTRSMYHVTTTTTKNNDNKKRRKRKRRDKEENAFHIIARCKESYKNPLETLKFMLEECFTQQQDEDDEDDSLLLETLLSQKGRRKGGKRRQDGKKTKKKIPLELAAKQTVVSREPFAFQMLKKKTPLGVCAEKATRRYEKSRAREATLFEARREKALEEKRKSEQMKWNEKLREANEEDEGDELLYERLWEYEDEEKEEDEETRRGKYSSAATMKNNKRSLSADDDARKEKKKKKKKEEETEAKKGEEKHRTIPEEEERDGFKSPTERELRKRNGGSLPIATTQSYYAIWRACSKKAEKKTLRAKDLPYLHDVGDQSESSAIEWILKSSVSGPEGGCSCEAPRKSHHSKSCAVKLLRSEMLRWHPDRFVSRFRGCFFSLREEEEALVKVNATSARCVEMFRNFKTRSSST
jgi:hypothetical protein